MDSKERGHTRLNHTGDFRCGGQRSLLITLPVIPVLDLSYNMIVPGCVEMRISWSVGFLRWKRLTFVF